VAWEGGGWILKKKLSNQSTTGRVGAKEVPIVFIYETGRYIYGTTLFTDVEAWPGVGDGIFSGSLRLHVRMYTSRAWYLTNSYAMHCMWVAWSWCGNAAANAVEYGTKLNGIVQLKNYTLLHLRIWLGRISRLSLTVPVLYVTQ
jgi:hypothetical protein